MGSIDNSPPLLSICCATYNHEKFLAQCLDGFVMQKTNFAFEILVHEDASTDQTPAILKRYETKYPHLFRCVYQSENQFLKQNALTNILFPMARGKYLALCEGDDYWTDPLKLQMQVDQLEASTEFSICFHNTEERRDDENTPSFLYVPPEHPIVSELKDLAAWNFIPTCSAVFRNNLNGIIPDWFQQVKVGDWPLHIYNAHFGKIRYIPKIMGVHRIHEGSIWSMNSQAENSKSVVDTYNVLIDVYSGEIEFKERLIAGRERIANPPKGLTKVKIKEPLFKRVIRKFKWTLKKILPSWIVKAIKKETSLTSIKEDVNASHVIIGDSLLFKNFSLNARMALGSKTYVRIGNDSMIGGTFTFESPTGEVIIGDRVYIAGGNVICTNRIEIEDDVFVSWGVYFFDNDSHSVDYRDRMLDMQNHLKDWRNGMANYNTSKEWAKVKSAPIKICQHAWIGMECKILKGVTIGKGAIVGSGSVVTKDVSPWTIVAGNPAVKVKDIPFENRASG